MFWYKEKQPEPPPKEQCSCCATSRTFGRGVAGGRDASSKDTQERGN